MEKLSVCLTYTEFYGTHSNRQIQAVQEVNK